MGYRADLAIDLTMHSRADLAALTALLLTRPGQAAESPDLAWQILARLSEFADGQLEDLHLTGWGSGNLRTGHERVIAALARHADGTIDGLCEDGRRWQIQLHAGTATLRRHPAADPADPARHLANLPEPRTHAQLLPTPDPAHELSSARR